MTGLMKAVVLTRHGGLDKLDYREDWPVPEPGAGEVLVRVGACGLNNTDINTRTAWYSGDVTEGITDAGGKHGYADANGGDGSWGGAPVSFPRIQGADVAGRIVAVGADVVGGPMFAPLIDVLRQGGRYSSSGCIAGPVVEFDLRQLIYKDLKFTGATVVPPGTFARLVGYFEAGRLRPLLAATYPLRDLAKAQEAFMTKRHVGNIVVTTGDAG